MNPGAFTSHGNDAGLLKGHRHAGDRLAADVLAAFAGRGMVRMLERRADGIVLERLEPGTPVSTLVTDGRDDEATRILAGTIRQMHADTIPAGVPTVAELGASFAAYLASGDRQLPAAIVREGSRVHAELSASQTSVRLLHGDLHHDNILFDERRGWTAIDPKGIVGEVEYDLAAALRNPVDKARILADPGVFDRRVDVFVRELKVDTDRVRRWAFAAALLAAIWTVEDGADPALRQRWIAFATMIQPHA